MITASKKVDYGILLMASLPESGESTYRSVQDIACEKKLSAGFLGQLMIPLRKAGLVHAKEGARGGYQLAKPSKDIQLCDIYEAIEGPLRLTACQDVQKKCVCETSCPTKGLWSDLQSLMKNYLQQRSLAEFKKKIPSSSRL